jgi:FkbM family methyltransferase
MNFASSLRYLAWRALRLPRPVTVALEDGSVIVLRPQPSHDLSVAYEIFVSRLYLPPRPLDSVRRIVDVGANVGYSLVWWGHQYPDARIVAFEPHPGHVAAIRNHLELNRMANRVELFAAAAGTEGGRAHLSDRGAWSSVGGPDDQGAIAVPIVDFFETLGEEPIDLMKLDCEGGELPLIMDPRFEQLNLRALVLEWHASVEQPLADRKIFARLESLGWHLEPFCERREGEMAPGLTAFGMAWGFR